MVTSTASKTSPAKSARRQPIRTYDAALRYLFSQTDYERMLRVRYNRDTFSLSRMKLLLKKLGDPHKQLRCVHIAGTKGKGSTATMLAEMLQACGHKVGLYTSPHLVDIRERIRVNGGMITQAALTRWINKVGVHIERMREDKPTFFEIFTAIAFLHFAGEGVDIPLQLPRAPPQPVGEGLKGGQVKGDAHPLHVGQDRNERHLQVPEETVQLHLLQPFLQHRLQSGDVARRQGRSSRIGRGPRALALGERQLGCWFVRQILEDNGRQIVRAPDGVDQVRGDHGVERHPAQRDAVPGQEQRHAFEVVPDLAHIR